MITEDYVSFETAKLLKEKGFDEKCSRYWQYDKANDKDDVDGICLCYCDGALELNNSELDTFFEESFLNFGYSVPTLQMAMKWLRDTFRLEIYPFHDAIQENNDWWYRIEWHSKGCSLTEHESDSIYKIYEEACEAAIKYCLENLV